MIEQTLQPASSGARCDCYCCRWDQARFERQKHRLEPSHPPDMPLYTAAQLMECESFMRAGPVNPGSRESAEYWTQYGGHLLDWLRREVAEGRIDEPEPAKYGAQSLLSVVEFGSGPVPVGDAREPYAWSPLGGRELLFDWTIHGMVGQWDERIVAESLASFLRYLAEQGIVDAGAAGATQKDLEKWTPSFIEACQ